MKPDDFQRVSQVFEEARRRAPDQRAAFLDSACRGEAGLRAEVESLLAFHDDDRHPLTGAAIEAAVGSMAEDVLSDQSAVEALRSGGGSEDAEATRSSRIGQYTIIKKLGEGGMGIVYEARQDNPRRTVALKVIRRNATSRQLLRRFELEAHLLGQLQHPGIAQIFEAGTARGDDPGASDQPYFAMEYIQGEPLNRYAARRNLGTRERLSLFADVCDAVQYAHGQGVIHRDLKPPNILVDGSDRAKILDFGVARVTDADLHTTTLQTDVGQLVGTVPYMSPEQIAGEPGGVDTRSDVYALGVILYELLAGRLPYDLPARSVVEAARVIQAVEPTRLSSLDTAFRGDVDTIVSKALEKDLTRRYQSAAELAADLRRYLANQPIGARPASAIYQLRKFARRNKALVGGTAAVFVVLVAGTLVSLSQAVRATRAESLARERLAAALAAQSLAEQRQQEAERQTRIAQAVNAFLNDDLLAAVDPENTADREITMREVLDNASRSIADEFPDEPLVEAAIRVTLGKTYRSLGAFPAALPHLERALALNRATLGEDHADSILAANELGLLFAELDRLEEAETLFVDALARERKRAGAKSPDALIIANNLAYLYHTQRRYHEAEPLYRETLQAQRRLLGPDDPATLNSMNNLGLLYFDQRLLDQAEPLFTDALEGKRRVLGEEHPHTLDSVNNLAQLYRAQQRFEEAEPLYLRAVDLGRRVLGDDHPRTLMTLGNLAELYVQSHRDALAEPLFAEVLGQLRRRRGTEDSETLYTMNRLAGVYRRSGRYPESEALYQEILATRTRVLGPEDPKTLASMSNLAAFYRDSGRLDAAASLGLETLELHRRVLGPEHRGTANVLNSLTVTYLNQQRFAEAEPLVREALASRLRESGAEHRRTIICMSNLGRSLRGQDRLSEALSEFDRALAAAPGVLRPDDPLFATIQVYQGECLAALKRFAEAEEQLRAGYETLHEVLGASHERTRLAVEYLANLYEAWGRPDQAAEWHHQLTAASDPRPTDAADGARTATADDE